MDLRSTVDRAIVDLFSYERRIAGDAARHEALGSLGRPLGAARRRRRARHGRPGRGRWRRGRTGCSTCRSRSRRSVSASRRRRSSSTRSPRACSRVHRRTLPDGVVDGSIDRRRSRCDRPVGPRRAPRAGGRDRARRRRARRRRSRRRRRDRHPASPSPTSPRRRSPTAILRDGDRTVLASRTPRPVERTSRARSEWRTLTGAALVGLGSGRARTRRARTSPSASSSARRSGRSRRSSTRWPTSPVALDGAQLLARKAAWALDAGRADAADARCDGLLVRGRARASAPTERGLHFHGGYGFMQEYDIQLYYRRAKGWPLVLDTPHARVPAPRGAPVRARSPVAR